jgi:glycosyltransferase involved in cell wall biosynthesis
MKVLFDHSQPFSLAHGGVQVQIEQTREALARAGCAVEYLRWWDSAQTGDLIHFFGVARAEYLRVTRMRNIPTVMTPFFSETCNRPRWRLELQATLTRAIWAMPLFRQITRQLNWTAYRNCSHLTVGLEAEKGVLIKVYGVAPGKISVVPLGVSESFLNAKPADRQGNYLITTGTISPTKCSLELAKLARAAEVPILFVGKPYDAGDAYWGEFQALVDQRCVNYHSHVHNESELINLLRSARGFVLYSQFENWSLAASEAVACGLPLLLRDQKWSRERFGAQVEYFEKREKANVQILRRFHEESPRRSPPAIKLSRWDEVAERLRELYAAVLSNSR